MDIGKIEKAIKTISREITSVSKSEKGISRQIRVDDLQEVFAFLEAVRDKMEERARKNF